MSTTTRLGGLDKASKRMLTVLLQPSDRASHAWNSPAFCCSNICKEMVPRRSRDAPRFHNIQETTLPLHVTVYDVYSTTWFPISLQPCRGGKKSPLKCPRKIQGYMATRKTSHTHTMPSFLPCTSIFTTHMQLLLCVYVDLYAYITPPLLSKKGGQSLFCGNFTRHRGLHKWCASVCNLNTRLHYYARVQNNIETPQVCETEGVRG